MKRAAENLRAERSEQATDGAVAVDRRTPPPKRDRILAAGLALFSKGPYPAVTMDRVAEAAGVAKGTLYLYFESKEALYLGIVREGLESIVSSYQATVDLNTDVTERMRRAIEASIEFYGRRRDLLRLLMTEEPRMAEARNRLIEEWRELGLRFFSSLIDEGIKQGRFTPVDSRLATLAILGGIRSVLLYYGEERPLDGLSRDLSAFLLRGVGGASAQLQRAK
ncbi:MAG: TetR/AcrR family transcriptional regulator [Candidatus Binataceae bacterium]